MPAVFISYRRDDSVGHAGHLFDRLAERFGKHHIYRDLDSIQAGEDFLETIRAQVRRSDVLIALIGPRWLSAADEDGRWRLARDDDLVRIEIVTALERGTTRVIPVLVGGAKMPQAKDLPGDLGKLARLNAVEVRDSHFDQDVDQLAEILGRPRWRHWVRRVAPYAVAAVLVASAGLAGWRYWQTAMSPEQARIKLAQIGVPYTPEAFVGRAEQNDARAVDLFLRAGTNPDATNSNRQTALMWAARNGQTSMARALLDRGAHVDTALPWAAGWHQAEILEMLMRRHPSAAAINKALFAAAAEGDTSIVQTLLRRGGEVNGRSEGGLTPLMVAADAKQLPTIRLLLASGADVKATDKRSGWTALHAVASANQGDMATDSAEIVRTLLEHGADVDGRAAYVNDTKDWTPLLVAAYKQAPAIASLLLEHGANPNVRSEYKDRATALILSIGVPEQVQALLAKGADVNAADDKGRTPLIQAADQGQVDIIKALLAHGANVNAKDKTGRTALMFAAARGERTPVQVLSDAGADVNARNDNGGTALLWAAANGATDVVELLLARDAGVNASSRTGFTALMLAAGGGHSDTVRALLQRGANPDLRNRDGQTALMMAEEKGDKATIQVLRAK